MLLLLPVQKYLAPCSPPPAAGKSRAVWWAAQSQSKNKQAYEMKQERADGSWWNPG